MLTMPRWEAEIRLMRRAFPQFRPFAVPRKLAGFQGDHIGPRTGARYIVAVQSQIVDYPDHEPGVYMDPHPESHHWIRDNRLCYKRVGHVWNPAEDTFAQVLLFVFKYIDEFDGR